MTNRMKELRVRMKISQREYAERIGISQSTVSAYETGYTQPDFETLVRISDFFNVTVDYIIGKSDNPSPACVVSDVDPQLLEIAAYLKTMNAEGIQKVVEYADLLSSSGRYPKRPLRM